jgi:hypothetical protein
VRSHGSLRQAELASDLRIGAPAGGTAGWQITLIAIGAALFTAAVAVLMDRARGAPEG